MKLLICLISMIIFFTFNIFADSFNFANVSVSYKYSKIRNMDYTNVRNNQTYRTNYYLNGIKFDKDFSDYINLGFIVGNIEAKIKTPSNIEINSNENIYFGLDFLNTVRLTDDLKILYNIGYLNSLKKDIKNSTTNLEDFYINKFWTEAGVLKEFVSASFKVAAGYVDSKIRSGNNSSPDELFLRLNNDINFYINTELNFEVNPEFDFYIGYSFLASSNVYAGLVYHFGPREAAEYKPKPSRADATTQIERKRVSTPDETRQKLQTQAPSSVTFPEKTAAQKEQRQPAPNTFQNYRDEGLRFFNAGNYNEALKNFEFALRLKPDSIEIHKLLGDTYEKLGEFTKALEHYDTAIQLINQQ